MLHDEYAYHVQLGSGMGMGHSGELTDVCFHVQVEIESSRPDMLRQYKIDGYYRFKDERATARTGQTL